MPQRALRLSLLFVSFATLMCSTSRTFRPDPRGAGGEGGEGGSGAVGHGVAGHGEEAGERSDIGGSKAASGGTKSGAAGRGGQGSPNATGGGSGAGEAGASGAHEAAGVAGQSGEAGEGGTSAGGSAGSGSAGTSSGAAGTNGGGTGGGASCASPASQCLKAAPPNWRGPVLVSANAVPSCPSGFPTPLPALNAGLVPGSASCTCDCGVPTTTCGGSASPTLYSGDSCTGSTTGHSAGLNVCVSTTSATEIHYDASVSASCDHAQVQPDIPTPQWTTSLNVCGDAVQQGACTAGDEVCVASPAAPFDARYCVTSSVETDCPVGYPVLSSMFEHYDDGRTCPSDCSCTASGQTCQLEVDTYAASDCSGSMSVKFVAASGQSCVISNPAVRSAYEAAAIVQNPGQCAPNGTLSATGEVTTVAATTLCCTQ